jgi:hypothetical protein
MHQAIKISSYEVDQSISRSRIYHQEVRFGQDIPLVQQVIFSLENF